MEIYKKIENCKKAIKNTKMKKGGKNTFSGYEYFTPQQIEDLVFQVCEENNLLTKFDLKRNEFGVTGILSIICTEKSECVTYEMATAIPEIKATNIAQQLGGCVTYTERYLKTSAFGIVDNSLDFDAAEKKETDKAEKTKAQQFLQEKLTELEQADSFEKIFEIKVKYKELLMEKSFSELFKKKLDSSVEATKKLLDLAKNEDELKVCFLGLHKSLQALVNEHKNELKTKLTK